MTGEGGEGWHGNIDYVLGGLYSRHDWIHEEMFHANQVKEVGDGNINYVYILEGPSGALCLKQGHPYVRIMKSWELTQVRLTKFLVA